MEPERFLGIEGGATGTTAAITDGELNVLARTSVGPTNIHAVGAARAEAAVERLLLDVLLPAGARHATLTAAAFCMAGLRGPSERRAWRRITRRAGLRCPCRHTHDATAGLAAGSADGTGILVTSGTGSFAYGRRADGRERFVGGRGPILGDEGSGFDMGQRGLRAAIRSADGRGEKTVLETLIPERLGLEGLEDLVAWVSPFAKDRVARVAPIVLEAANQGDAMAHEIAWGAADELAHSAALVARTLWPEGEGGGPGRVVLSGGVLLHNDGFRESVSESLGRLLPGVPCVRPEVDGATGAARVARRWLRETR